MNAKSVFFKNLRNGRSLLTTWKYSYHANGSKKELVKGSSFKIIFESQNQENSV